jgi:HK97 family phage portal protein
VSLIRRAASAVRELRSSPENPQYPLTSQVLIDLMGGSPTVAGPYINEQNAHKMTAVYRAWALIAGTIGTLPLRTFAGIAPGEELWEGPAANLLLYPGGRDPVTGIAYPGAPTATVFFETMIVHMLAWGNAYVVRVPSVLGNRIVSLDLLYPWRVRPIWVKKTPENPTGKAFMVDDDDQGPMIAYPKDVIHIRAMGTDLLKGISPIGAARQALGVAVAAEEYGARLFGSGSLMSGILQTDAELDQETADRLKERWKAKMSGLGSAHEVAVMDSGVKWQSISIPPEDAQFLQTREFAVTEVARLYGIPPHMLMQVEKSTSWGSGIEEQGLAFSNYTLRPWLVRIEQALSNELLPRGVNCRFQTAELLRGDVDQRYKAYQTAIMNGVMTPNEARAREGMHPLDGGESLMFPSNYITLKVATEAGPPNAAITGGRPNTDPNAGKKVIAPANVHGGVNGSAKHQPKGSSSAASGT